MRRSLYTLLIAFLVILVIYIFNKPIIIFFTRQQLNNVFKESKVLIGDCGLKLFNQISYFDIEIKREGIYDIKTKEARIDYNFFSLLKRSIPNFYLKDIVISINQPQKSILELNSYLNLKPNSIFRLKNLELSNLNLNLKSKDLNIQANLSTDLSLIKQIINYLDVMVSSLDVKGLRLENASLKVDQKLALGDLSIAQIKYNKVRIGETKSKSRLNGKNLFLDSLSAKVFDGEIKGDLSFSLDKNREYLVNLKFINIDLDTFVKDFNLSERFQMSGRLSGRLALAGRGLNIKILNGDFFTAEPGGVLTIRDNKFLENVARSSKQSLDILVESFKNYHYNTGIIRLFKQEESLVLDIVLDGEAGKRYLNATLHISN